MPNILLVEDNIPIRDSLEALLSIEGYRIEVADHGAEALTRLRVIERPDLILLDLMMPVMSGWEFLEKLRADSTLGRIPVLILSAVGGKDQIVEMANGHLAKPVDIDMLLARVKTLCN